MEANAEPASGDGLESLGPGDGGHGVDYERSAERRQIRRSAEPCIADFRQSPSGLHEPKDERRVSFAWRKSAFRDIPYY